MHRFTGIPEFLTELIERLDAHTALADHSAESAALRHELQGRCSPAAWEAFTRLEEALKQREKVLFNEVIEFFLLPEDWEGPSLD